MCNWQTNVVTAIVLCSDLWHNCHQNGQEIHDPPLLPECWLLVPLYHQSYLLVNSNHEFHQPAWTNCPHHGSPKCKTVVHVKIHRDTLRSVSKALCFPSLHVCALARCFCAQCPTSEVCSLVILFQHRPNWSVTSLEVSFSRQHEDLKVKPSSNGCSLRHSNRRVRTTRWS